MEVKEYVYNQLDKLQIQYLVINHKAMFSEEDTNFDDFANNITIGKNLFLRNKKKNKYYLIIVPLLKKIDLNKLAEKLEEKRFSFANESELDKFLKISPGSVSYLNVITAEKLGGNIKEITYIIDSEILDNELVAFHPSDNTASVVTNPKSILTIFEKYGLKYNIINL